MDQEKTRVLFVKPRYPNGQREILALFPDHKKTKNFISCYSRLGQHGVAHMSFLRRVKATPDEYAPLARELSAIGYNLEIMNQGE